MSFVTSRRARRGAPSRRRSRRSPVSVQVVVATAVLALLGSLLGGGSSGAQDIDSLRRRAEELADQLKDLEHESAVADEEYLVTLDQIDSVKAEMVLTEAAVAEARANLAGVESQVSTYLVTSFMEAGSSAALLAAASSTDVNEVVNQQVLLETLRGDRLQLAEDISARRSDLDARNSELADQQRSLDALEDERKAAKERLEGLVEEQQGLYDSASAELREAVAAEQRRREEEAARRAAEQIARAQAEAAAAAQRQAAAAAAAAPRRSSPAAPTTVPAASSSGGPPPVAQPPAPAAPPPVAAPSIPPNSGAAGAIAAAKSQLGLPYRYGGSSPSTGFDCSGLMLWSWAQVGVSLPRTSGAQFAATQRIPISQLQPGDLVFFGSPVYHVGMYVGGGQMIHSPHTGDVVKISSIGYMRGVVNGGRIR
jgi:cell wall-associated NlpC family hydrolase